MTQNSRLVWPGLAGGRAVSLAWAALVAGRFRFSLMQAAPFSGGDTLQLFEHPGEMGGIEIARPLGHLADAQSRVVHQPFGLANAYRIQQIVEGLIQALVEQLGQAPPADIAVVGHVLEGRPLGAVPCDIGLSLADQKAAGVLAPRLGIRIRLRRQTVQHAGHVLQRHSQLVHFGGLEQKPDHA